MKGIPLSTIALANRAGLAAVCLCAGLALASACGAGDGSSGTGTGGSGASSTGGTTASSGDGGTLFGGNLNTGGGGGAGAGSCAGTSVQAEKLPLDMYIMLDQSGSMGSTDGSITRWEAVTTALEAFVQQPAAAGIGVGIQYFPLDSGSCSDFCFSDADCGSCPPCFMNICIGDEGCDLFLYSTPEVAIAPLPGVASAIISSMAGHGPTDGTPTAPTLQGALVYTYNWIVAHPDHVGIAVLATDGDPTDCNTDLGHINSIAATGANDTPQIRTFVIGVGNELTALNGIAAAGGSGQAFLVDTTQDVQQQFLDALNQIQGTALGCVYSIPEPTSGTPDFNKVNVEYLPGDGGAPQVIPKVNSEGDCVPGEDGWYYDDNTNPTQIIMCDSTCEKVSLDGSGQVDIVLGCATILR